MSTMATDGDVNEIARQKLDAKILDLRLQIAALSLTRNSLAPISRLPAELLTIIWVYARNFSPVSSKSKMAMVISWVSSDWRRISLDWSWLWSEIDLHHAKGINVFLARSRQAPLTLKLRGSMVMDATIFQHFPRLHDLEFTFPRDDSDDTRVVNIRECWSSPSPFLKFLSLSRTTVPPTLFTHPPPLQSLTLRNCRFDALPPLSGVTTLCISRPLQLMPVVNVLGTLQQLPNLVELTLDHVFFHSLIQQPFTFPGPAVQLSKLQVLNIAEQHRNPIPYLFQNVSIPGNTDAVFTISLDMLNFDLLGLLRSYHACRISPSPIHTLAVMKGRRTSEVKLLEQGPDSFGSITVSLSNTFHDNPFQQCSTLNLSSLQMLDLTLSERTGRLRNGEMHEVWNSCYGDLPNLRIVKASGYAAYTFLSLLAKEGHDAWNSYRELLPSSRQPQPITGDLEDDSSTSEQSSATQRRKQLLWKALRELILVFPTDDEPLFRETIDERHVIIDMLIRKEAGIAVTHIQYLDWPMSDGFLDRLKAVVGEVTELEP
ncbi:hypothetical protein BDN72DRAFT_962712 [Pluteus cervinus]|uniref:Uncharacterized protein n=1 Tax=Pluteus cervinus TaxID=181527 RepID=A0ACD3AI27_9AGAR|nr:hypothetical protein BDN72DRAFT_962712 [Pluteus cervinus]